MLAIAVMWLVGIYRARCVRVCSSGYVGRYCPGIFKVKRALGLPAGFQGQAYVNTRVKEPRLAIFSGIYYSVENGGLDILNVLWHIDKHL